MVALLVGDLDPESLGAGELAAPHLLDSEVTNALRHLVLRDELDDTQATAALDGFTRLTLVRYPADRLRLRMWALRHNLSAYDATYVALAERLGEVLLTTDGRLARAPGITCTVAVL